MNDPFDDYRKPGPARFEFILMICLAATALLISAYLSYTSMSKGMSPAGCGSGSGCAEVLSSKFSHCLGIPVSLLAMGVYIGIIIALFFSRSANEKTNYIARFVLSLLATVIAGSAIWFIYLQLIPLRAICPYCMADHTIGLILAPLLFWRIRLRSIPAIVLGLVLVLAMMLVQMGTSSMLITLDTHSSDQQTATGRTVTVLDGKLTLNLSEEPLLGPPDGKQVMVMMLDYACLHCRHTHSVVEEYQEQHPGRLTVVLLPMPLNHGCNPHVSDDIDERFKESCELTRIAVAFFLADPGAYPDFDRWMYEPVQPRTAKNARAEAIRRLGEKTFEQAYNDPRMQDRISRNVLSYGESGADYVPVLFVPGAPAVVGRLDNVGALQALLDRASSQQSQ